VLFIGNSEIRVGVNRRDIGLSSRSRTEIRVTSAHSESSTNERWFSVIVTSVRFNIRESPRVEIVIRPVFVIEIVSNVTDGFSSIGISGSGSTVNTFVSFLEHVKFEVRESHSFITSTLIDGGSEIERSSRGRVSNGIINIIEVISPRRSTKISNIGVRPSRLLGVENGSV
jgi:hypothetical protein